MKLCFATAALPYNRLLVDSPELNKKFLEQKQRVGRASDCGAKHRRFELPTRRRLLSKSWEIWLDMNRSKKDVHRSPWYNTRLVKCYTCEAEHPKVGILKSSNFPKNRNSATHQQRKTCSTSQKFQKKSKPTYTALKISKWPALSGNNLDFSHTRSGKSRKMRPSPTMF